MSLNHADSLSVAGPSPRSDGLLSIGDMARAFDISQRALRFYEDRGLLSPRREGSVRLYGARERRRLDMILRGKRLGFTLTEIIGFMTENGAGGWSLGREQIAVQIAHLERQRDGLDAAITELRAASETLGGP